MSVERPVVGVLAIVRRGDQLLLAQRSKGSYKGRWGFPGGHLERGETVIAAALRELREETGVEADARSILTALDEIGRDAGNIVQWHYVLVAVLADWRSGEAVAADDAAGVRWATLDDIAGGSVDVLANVERVARLAFSSP
jgi:ADP-ribose pyrophosphatase YjhB (NUDIX family)